MEKAIQNFVCIGAQKAGTTTLADILSLHPDICIPEIKETKFFLFDDEYKNGLEYYTKTYFSSYKNQNAVGEFDPDYLLFPFTAERIYKTLGKEIKLIVVLRNPADRAYSHYLMTKRKGLEPLSFTEAIEKESSRKNSIKEQKIFAYLERGFYGAQLQEFLKYFPKENFLFLLFEEDIIRNRENTISTVQKFLHVNVEALNTNIHSNEAGEFKSEAVTNLVRKPNFAKKIFKKILPSTSVRKNLRKFFLKKNMKAVSSPRLDEQLKKEIINKHFKEDILLTQKLTGKNLSIWLQ